MADRPGPLEIEQSEHLSPPLTGDNISAKRVASYVWNPVGIDINNNPDGAWERDTGSGGTTVFIERYDFSSPPVYYIGEAPTGTTEGSSTWLITKYDLTSSADSSGLIAANVEWTNRSSASYG